jgi:hypothetical protein
MVSEPEITHKLGCRTVWKVSNDEDNGNFLKMVRVRGTILKSMC